METKVCTKCKETKPLNLFRVDTRLKSGRGSQCHVCVRGYALKYRNKNLEKVRTCFTSWQSRNKEYATKRKLEWAKENREKTLAAGRRYYYKNRDARIAVQKSYREANKERYAAKQKEWKQNNMDYIVAANAMRRANKMQRTPKWLTKEDKTKIKQIYREAKRLTAETGEQYHVDHILPLQGKLVSGFHVPTNLQILHWKDNLSKRHKYTP